MKISIITVCFNSAETIAHTLRSVREQTFENIEHIVIDGGSSDRTLDIIAREGGHVARVISEKDAGIYDAMNKGVRQSSGDVIAFLNADDFYKHANVVAHVAAVMKAEDLDALYGNVEFFNRDDSEVIVRRYNSARFTPNKIGWGWMPAHPALFLKRSVFDKYGMFRTDYRIAGDFEFIARIFKTNALKHRHLPESLVCMQTGGISTSGWRATLRLNQEMMRACRANAISTNWIKILLRYPFKLMEYFRISM